MNTDPSARPLRILVVEDHADTALTTALVLRGHGHHVQTVADGAAALAAAQGSHWDVVLLDIGLPDRNGWALAQELRQYANGKRPLFIAVTGYGQEQDHERSKEAGIDLHLVKPADPQALLRLLERFQELVSL